MKHNNNNSNNIILNNNNSVKSKKDFPQLVLDSFEPLLSLFQKKLDQSQKAQKNSWLDCIDKLDLELDGYNPEKFILYARKLEKMIFGKIIFCQY